MARTPSTPLADSASPEAADLPSEHRVQEMNAEQALAAQVVGDRFSDVAASLQSGR